MRTVKDILTEASLAAGSIDSDLARKVLDAEDILDFYGEDGLPIEISFWAAVLTGRLNFLWKVKQIWHPTKGILVERAGVKDMPDHEEFPNSNIVSALPPDIDYVWLVDAFRAVQSVYNFFVGWIPTIRWKPLDLWGDIKLTQSGGGGDISLHCVRNPSSAYTRMRKLAESVSAGQAAKKELVKRADNKRADRHL